MSSSWNRPQLKSGVDLQLQSAFNDGNWALVIRLAEKRLRTINDQYYEVVKVCAESQLDSTAEKSAALVALDRFLNDGTVVKDVESLELLEWACQNISDDSEFSSILDPLRLRLVKANPKDQANARRCLESCLLHWDLVSAQQIAALLDKSFPNERSLLFWNITITYLLAIDGQCPPEKARLYGMLALKQIQRAAQSAEQAVGSDKPPDRAIQTEEEILLLYSILESHGSNAEWEAVLKSPLLSPIKQFELGRRELFIRTLSFFERQCNWAKVYDLCKQFLSSIDENGRIRLLASDWSVWKAFISAAAKIREVSPEVQDEISILIQKHANSEKCPTIYKRILSLARLESIFQLSVTAPPDDPTSPAISRRLQELCLYIDSQCSNSYCFDDIRSFVEKLEPTELTYLAKDHIPRLAKELEDPVRVSIIKGLGLKLRYFISTCPQMTTIIYPSFGTRRWRCAMCDSDSTKSCCWKCLVSIRASATKLYRSLSNLSDSGEGIESRLQGDLLPDLAILLATCCIKISEIGQNVADSSSPVHLPLYSQILRATVYLENQLVKTPKHSQITLLLIRLYLVLGCASRAGELWNTLDIKRTIIDSLGPLFYDRVSSISPGLVLPPDKPERLMDGVQSHYVNSLKLRMPRRLIDAFETENYSSILDIVPYINRLRRSCTMVMGYVEESRAARALGDRASDIIEDHYFAEISDTTVLEEVIDYGALPNLECGQAHPLQDILRLGPGPSNNRSHLALLVEEFAALFSFKPPGVHKVTNTAHASSIDQAYVLETLHRLQSSINKFLRHGGKHLTTPELTYCEVISLLAKLVPMAIAARRSEPVPGILSQVVSGLTGSLDILHDEGLSFPPRDKKSVLLKLAALHGLSYLRDTAIAVKLATAFITVVNEREKERDRSGLSNLHKGVVAQITALDKAANQELQAAKLRIADLKAEVSKHNFEQELIAWTFGESDGDADEGTRQLSDKVDGGITEWAKILANSWRKNIKGWEHVRWST